MPVLSDSEAALDRLVEAKGWVFDIDGTLMRTTMAGGEGGSAFPGAGELVRRLRGTGRRVMVCTQASTRPPADYAEILSRAGCEVGEGQIMTAGLGSALHLRKLYPDGNILVLGSDGIVEPLLREGLTVVRADNPGAVDAVIVGYAQAYETRFLDIACKAIIAGAGFYTTTDDLWFHGGIGRSLAPSAFIAAAIGEACGRRAEVLGKPSAALGSLLLERLGLRGPEVVVVDDNLAHGIRLAHAMDAYSVMPLCGASSRDDLAVLRNEEAPTLVCADVGELNALLCERLHPIAWA